MNMIRGLLACAVVAGSLTLGSAAHATLLGDTVQLDYRYPDINTVFQTLGTANVSPTATFNSFGQTQYLVTAATLDITNTAGNDVNFISASFNGVKLTDLTNADITGVTVDSVTNLAGFSPANVSFGASHIFINLSGLTTTPSTLVRLDIITSAVAVPEPDTLLVLGGGVLMLGAFAAAARRRQDD